MAGKSLPVTREIGNNTELELNRESSEELTVDHRNFYAKRIEWSNLNIFLSRS